MYVIFILTLGEKMIDFRNKLCVHTGLDKNGNAGVLPSPYIEIIAQSGHVTEAIYGYLNV